MKIWITLCLLTASLFCAAQATEKRDLLTRAYSEQQLGAVLFRNQDWVWLPAYNNRAFWEQLPAPVRSGLIAKGEEALSFQWNVIKATDYLAYVRTGDRGIMEQPYTARKTALKNLVMAELAEGKGRFLDQIINGVWAICEQSTWVLSAHLHLQKTQDGLPDRNNVVIDLGAGDTGALLSWIYYFFQDSFDKVHPLLADRIRYEVRRHILEPYYNRTDLWWMGFDDRLVNNWNPWINYNVLQCILLMEDDPALRVKNVHKVMASVDKFINSYHDDGACDEGPSYWSHAGGKFFECIELLYRATNGKVSIFDHPLVKRIGAYIYTVYISDPYFVNFADASAKGGVNAGLVYRYGRHIKDTVMMQFGAFYARQKQLDAHAGSGSLESVITDLQMMQEIMACNAREPLIGEYWYPQTEVAIAREQAGSKQGFYFAAKGGHNAEFHNHNDVGSFVLYYNGLPCLADAGVGVYTRQTFSADRYKLWTMRSSYHNLPVINGVEQKAGRQFKAAGTRFAANGRNVEFATDIAAAYPADARVKSWKRSYRLVRGGSFAIQDDYVLDAAVAPHSLNFITPCAIQQVRPGLLKLEGAGFALFMHYDRQAMTPETEKIPINDRRLENSWPEGLYRLRFNTLDKRTKGAYRITVSPEK